MGSENEMVAVLGLLREARWYVNDSLEAHEHSDGRDLLNRIDARLAPAQPDAQQGEGLLTELATFLPSIRVFLTSRERSHEAGVQWFDEIVAKVSASQATPANDIAAKAHEYVKAGDYRMAYLTMCEAYGRLGVEVHQTGVSNRPLNYEALTTPSSPALDAATIERCAQVAESFDSCGVDSDPTHFIPCEIAAAIRALPNAEKRHG